MLGVAMILNQAQIGFMEEFGGGGENNSFQSGRFTASMSNLQAGSTLASCYYGLDGQILATGSIGRFTVSSFSGSLPPSINLADRLLLM